MKNTNILLAAGIMLFSATTSAFASYTMDGDLSDWGINLSAPGAQNKYYLDTHTPSGGNGIDYVTEDNEDIYNGTVFVDPGYSHNNRYDAEAMYMDNDYNYLYLAIVTGVSPSESVYPAGDIFFDAGVYQNPISGLYDPKKYGFGIDIQTGRFYSVNSWKDSLYYSAANPWKMGVDKTLIGNVDFIYTTNPVNSHYVMEAKIPMPFMNLNPQQDVDVWAHWTMKCGNDVMNLQGDIDASSNPVPEPATMSLMLLGGAGLGFIKKKKVKA